MIKTEIVKAINLDLPADLWLRTSIQAAKEDIKKRQLVIKALEQYLANTEKE